MNNINDKEMCCFGLQILCSLVSDCKSATTATTEPIDSSHSFNSLFFFNF